jgi:hypothetical protein
MKPQELIALGLVLVLIGWVIPLLTTLRLIEAHLVLLFLGHGASVAGMMLGLIGATQFMRRDRH